MKLIVSACLLGENCKYSGGNNKNENVMSLCEKFDVIPICPEVAGGLSTPREPSEISGDKVLSKNGDDVTAYFIKGAEIALQTAQKHNCRYALLKAKSPSCGNCEIYDGTFSGTLTFGEGVAAKLLRRSGITVFNETEIDKLLRETEK